MWSIVIFQRFCFTFRLYICMLVSVWHALPLWYRNGFFVFPQFSCYEAGPSAFLSVALPCLITFFHSSINNGVLLEWCFAIGKHWPIPGLPRNWKSCPSFNEMLYDRNALNESFHQTAPFTVYDVLLLGQGLLFNSLIVIRIRLGRFPDLTNLNNDSS